MNRNPENYFLDVEQAAFTPTNIVPGLDYSPDKMLQGRLFSYGDAQRYRLELIIGRFLSINLRELELRTCVHLVVMDKCVS